jgi:hypothetical protein
VLFHLLYPPTTTGCAAPSRCALHATLSPAAWLCNAPLPTILQRQLAPPPYRQLDLSAAHNIMAIADIRPHVAVRPHRHSAFVIIGYLSYYAASAACRKPSHAILVHHEPVPFKHPIAMSEPDHGPCMPSKHGPPFHGSILSEH